MNWTKHACTFVVATAVGVGTLSVGPAVAQPAPYTPQPTATVSTTNPPRGGQVEMKGKKWKPREIVVIRIRTKPKTLAKLTVNRKGKWRTIITLPKRYKCEHTLVVRGKSSGFVTRTPIFIGKPSKCP